MTGCHFCLPRWSWKTWFALHCFIWDLPKSTKGLLITLLCACNTWTMNIQMFKLVLEKTEELEIKLPTSAGSLKKQESSWKTSISALLTMPKPLTGWITINWKILKEMGIPDRLTLRNLYAGQEATVRTGHGTTNWFQIGKGVCQGCILSPCLFNLYAEYIMRNTGLEEAQAGTRLPGEISITSDMQMIPPLWQKVKRS